MKIPIFLSGPSLDNLSEMQEASRKMVLRELDRHGLEARALGRSDYPVDLPLREVHLLAKHCSGGVILGFEQFHASAGVWKRGAPAQKKDVGPVRFPTSWNHLEAGILYSLGLPILVFAEEGITGGVFDRGVTDVFVHKMPSPSMKAASKKGLQAVFQKWQASVRTLTTDDGRRTRDCSGRGYARR